VATAQPSNGVQVERLGAGDQLTVKRDRKNDRVRADFAEADGMGLMPSAGAVWTLKDLFADYGDEILPKVAMAVTTVPAPEQLALMRSFAKPVLPSEAPAEFVSDGDQEEVHLASVPPLPRPRVELPAYFAKVLKSGSGKDEQLMAYAPSTDSIDAPFEAVMGGAQTAKPKAEAKKPADAAKATAKKPNLLGWLANRAFRRDQHDWASTPLPQSVHLAKEQDCLAKGVYFEARGEPELGQAAVAQVILNRVKNPTYPDTICGVVYQNQDWRNRCQFSFACDGIPDRITQPESWERAQRVAREVTNGKIWITDVGDSTHYHADFVNPRWASTMKKVDTIGAHIFYRTKRGGWS
jgi:spore germination cell wall hydrolase CwlJ-like protein